MQKNKKLKNYFILIIVAFITTLMTSSFSPLFKFNYWCDTGIFYTVGSGMMHGLIPYKDLFEQKGPLLYLIFGIASLIRPNWDIFLGGYFLDIIVLAVSMIILYKISLYVTKKSRISLIISLLLPIVQCSGISGTSGGVPESISIPIILELIYFTLKFMNSGFKSRHRDIFIQGILFGLVFWMKYTLVGAWLGLSIAIIVIFFKEKRFMNLITYLMTALAGFLVVSIPWIIYFIMNNALYELWQTYFYYNIGFYHDTTPILMKLFKALWYTIFPWTDGFSDSFVGYASAFVWILFILGEFIGIFSKKILKNWTQKLTILLMLLFNGVMEYWGGFHWVQYKLILIPFISFALLWLAMIFKTRRIQNNIYILVSIFTLFTLILINGNIRSSNSKLMYFIVGQENYEKKWGKQKIPVEFKFSNIMHKKNKKPTLLMYDNIEGEFYYAANIQPINRFFIKLASTEKKYPPMMENQKDVIRNKKVDFVVCQAESKKQFYKKYKNVLKNYNVICIEDGYYLLEKK